MALAYPIPTCVAVYEVIQWRVYEHEVWACYTSRQNARMDVLALFVFPHLALHLLRTMRYVYKRFGSEAVGVWCGRHSVLAALVYQYDEALARELHGSPNARAEEKAIALLQADTEEGLTWSFNEEGHLEVNND